MTDLKILISKKLKLKKIMMTQTFLKNKYKEDKLKNWSNKQ